MTIFYAGLSFYFLDKYPLFIAEEMAYCDPSINLIETGKSSFTIFHPVGSFKEISILQHGYILLYTKALIFKCFGTSIKTLRLESYLAGLAALVFIYLICQNTWLTFLIGMSNPFFIASHSCRPDINICLLITMIVWLLQDRSS